MTLASKARSHGYDARRRLCRCGCGAHVIGRTERKHLARRKLIEKERKAGRVIETSASGATDERTEDVLLPSCASNGDGAIANALVAEAACTEYSCAAENSSPDQSLRRVTDGIPEPETEAGTLPGLSSPPPESSDENEAYFSDEDNDIKQDYKDLALLRLLEWKQKSSVSRENFNTLRLLLKNEFGLRIPSLYMMEKVLVDRCPIDLDSTLIEACPKGCVLFKGRSKDLVRCPECGEERWHYSSEDGKSRSSQPKGFFVHFSAQRQLSAIVADKRKVQAMTNYTASFPIARKGPTGEEGEPEILRDYFDGKAYRSACRAGLGNFGKPKTLYLALSTDGVEYSKNPSKSLWPFALEIVNLPPRMRRKFENSIVVGVLFGYPADMSSVLEYLVEELMEWREEWNVQFCYLIADTPALNKLLGFTGHTGMVKCPQHTYKGFYSPRGRGYYMPNELPLLAPENMNSLNHRSNKNATRVPVMSKFDRKDALVRQGIEELRKAPENKRLEIKQKYGLTDRSTPLDKLPGFLYDTAATFESLHVSLLGVGKLYIKLLCRDASLGKYPQGSNDFEISESDLTAITSDCAAFSHSIHPQLMPKKLRSPQDGLNLRAEHFSNLIFALPALLVGRLPRAHVFGAAAFVEALSLISQTSLDSLDRDRLQRAVKGFMTYFYANFYRQSDERIAVCSYIVHRFGDAPGLIELHGPAWTTWSFYVESLGGLIAKSVKSMSNPEANIANTVQMSRRLALTKPYLEQSVKARQLRRVRSHQSKKMLPGLQYCQDTEEDFDDGSNSNEDYQEEIDQSHADDHHLEVRINAFAVLDDESFRALVRYLFPNVSGRLFTEKYHALARDTVGKYVSTYRKLRGNGWVFVSAEAAEPARRQRCYAYSQGSGGEKSVTKLIRFFQHTYNNQSLQLCLFREAHDIAFHDDLQEYTFRSWGTPKVGPIESFVKPAAVVKRENVTSQRGTTYINLDRVEMLARLSFQQPE